MACRGVRGATTVPENSREAMLQATRELLAWMILANDIAEEDVSAAFFTATPDLDAAFPAEAARQLGWRSVPLFGAQEMAVKGAPSRSVRVLLLWETNKTPQEIRHVYLNEAANLRPDIPRPNLKEEDVKIWIENHMNRR
jgi:chorismate mutase